MTSSADVLKEYLVKLGWDVDELGFTQAMNKVSTFADKLKNSAKFSSTFIKAGAGFFSAIIATNTAFVKLLDNITKADTSVERFARKMWTTEENARAFQSALDAMNADYDDIFWMTPEEFNRFMELKKLASDLKAPKELQQSLVTIRQIGAEVSKLKMIAQYATQWIAYYFTRFMGGDLEKIRDKFKSLNDYLIQKLPDVTEKIAKFFYVMYRLGKVCYTVISRLKELGENVLGNVSIKAKQAAVGMAGLLLMFKLGPIGVFIAALTTLLLLLDDFFVWQSGGKSFYGDKWAKLAELFEKFKNNESLGKLKISVDNLKDSVLRLYNNAVKLFDEFSIGIDWEQAVENAFDTLNGVLSKTAEFLGLVADSLSYIIDLINGDISTEKLKDLVGSASKKTSDFFGYDQNQGNGLFDAIFGIVGNAYKGGFFNNPINYLLKGNDQKSIGQQLTETFNITVNASGTNMTPAELTDAVTRGVQAARSSHSMFR